MKKSVVAAMLLAASAATVATVAALRKVHFRKLQEEADANWGTDENLDPNVYADEDAGEDDDAVVEDEIIEEEDEIIEDAEEETVEEEAPAVTAPDPSVDQPIEIKFHDDEIKPVAEDANEAEGNDTVAED